MTDGRCKLHDIRNCTICLGTEVMDLAKLNEEALNRAARIEQLKAEQAVTIESLNSLDDKAAELEKQLKALKAAKSEQEKIRWANHNALKAESEALDRLNKQIALEAEARRAAELAAKRAASVDEATAGALWRKRMKQHQWDGALYLSAAQNAICADDMGLGKTLQAVGVINILEAMGDSDGDVLVIGPGEVAAGFEKEFTRYDPERMWIKLGGLDSGSMGTPAILSTLEMCKQAGIRGVFFINYNILARSNDVVDALSMHRFDTVILDEAHRVKETSKPTYKAVEKLVLGKNVCEICNGFAMPTTDRWGRQNGSFCPVHFAVEGKRSVRNCIPMTGTPVLNRPDEIYALLHLTMPDIFSDLHFFHDEYCMKSGSKWLWGWNGEKKLVNKIRGHYIGRSRLDAGVVLPPQEVVIHEVEVTEESYPKQHKILQMLARSAQIEIESGKTTTIFSILPLITRQRQAAVWPGGIWMDVEERDSNGVWVTNRKHVGAAYLESAKLDKAMELELDYIDQKQVVVCFSKFLEPLMEMQRRNEAEGIRSVVYAGNTPSHVKAEVKYNMDRDNGEEPKWDVVLCQYDVAGLGLNLTRATQAIILDQEWNQGMSDQAWKRIDRMGQTEETGVHIIRVKDSIDGWVADLIESKSKMVNGFREELEFSELADVFNKMDI